MNFLTSPSDSIGHSRCCTDEGSGPAELVSFGIWASRIWGQGSNRHHVPSMDTSETNREYWPDAHFILIVCKLL